MKLLKRIIFFLKTNKKTLLIIIAIFLILLGIIIENKSIINPLFKKEISNTISIKDPQDEEDIIRVTIKSGVRNSGIKEVYKGLYLFEIINNYFGGFTDYANTSDIDLLSIINRDIEISIIEDDIKKDNNIYFKNISENKNIKYLYFGRINDKDIIYIVDEYYTDDDLYIILNLSKDIKEGTSNNLNKVNINTCSINDLKTLSNIGEAKAKSIIEYREKNGLFKSIEEIMNVKGIGEALFNAIKDNICIG